MPTMSDSQSLPSPETRAVVKASPNRILVVEDDAALRELTPWGLQLAGYEVKAARDGIEAMELVQKESFDLILLDLLMPVVGGFGFLDWLRREQTLDTPVIVYTGQRDPTITERVQLAGATQLLWKPLCLDEILRTIQSILDG